VNAGSQVTPDQAKAIALMHQRDWFYHYSLPDGSATSSYLPAGVEAIHTTRLAMLTPVLDAFLRERDGQQVAALDIACHQGYFTLELARRGLSDVYAIDNRSGHLSDTALVARAYGCNNVRTGQFDIEDARAQEIGGRYDIVLMLGLIYHVENPIRILRLARALCRGICVIETQLVPNMNGLVDWGSWQFQRPMVASFGIIDETDETHGPEASAHGICVTPSYEALLWCMRKVGFTRIEKMVVPTGGYEQLATGKRVMVVGYNDN
jgi:tRNA (mo5U34)-methyltransferase